MSERTVMSNNSFQRQLDLKRCQLSLNAALNAYKQKKIKIKPRIKLNHNRDLYVDAMLGSIWMSTNMMDGNQQEHPLPSFATKA